MQRKIEERLVRFVYEGRCTLVSHMLRDGVSPDAQVLNGETWVSALHTAAIMDRPEMARLLLEAGATVDIRLEVLPEPVGDCPNAHDSWMMAKAEEGFTPLQVAASAGSLSVLHLLLAYEANLDVVPGPAALARRRGHHKLARLLDTERRRFAPVSVPSPADVCAETCPEGPTVPIARVPIVRTDEPESTASQRPLPAEPHQAPVRAVARIVCLLALLQPAVYLVALGHQAGTLEAWLRSLVELIYNPWIPILCAGAAALHLRRAILDRLSPAELNTSALLRLAALLAIGLALGLRSVAGAG
ncbi:MAG: ankyrin repeat domain-containing protein [Armatimonadetes bacterium]|nr:ankyrin repeat domain-containing protein [Armatimonadota bacterium]